MASKGFALPYIDYTDNSGWFKRLISKDLGLSLGSYCHIVTCLSGLW